MSSFSSRMKIQAFHRHGYCEDLPEFFFGFLQQVRVLVSSASSQNSFRFFWFLSSQACFLCSRTRYVIISLTTWFVSLIGWRIKMGTGCTADVLGSKERLIAKTITTHRGTLLSIDFKCDMPTPTCFVDSHNQKAAPSKGQAWGLNKSAWNLANIPLYRVQRRPP